MKRSDQGHSKIKALLFDFGGVLGVSIGPKSLLDLVEEDFGVDKKTLRRELQARAAGKKTAREIATVVEETVGLLSGKSVAPHAFDKALDVEFNRDNLTLVRALAPQFTMGIIANSDGSIAHRLERYGLADLFVSVVDSTIAGVKKPTEAIYLMAAVRAGCRPDECLFIDDKAENVLGARKAGMRALRYSAEAGSLWRLLKDAGIPVPVPA